MQPFSPGARCAHTRARCGRPPAPRQSGAPPERRAPPRHSASFTAVPYVEFDTAAMPNLAAYGIAVPTMVLITSTLRHRDRIPVAVLALVGVFSLHITGGIVVALLVSAWWLFEALRHPVRSRLADLLTLAGVAAMAGLVMLPQFLSVRQQEDIIAGHAFPTYLSKKRGLFDAVFQHSRHLNDFPVQYALIVLAAIGGLILLVKKIWYAGGLAAVDCDERRRGNTVGRTYRRVAGALGSSSITIRAASRRPQPCC